MLVMQRSHLFLRVGENYEEDYHSPGVQRVQGEEAACA